MASIFGWSYPPGVSGRDIDEHFGGDECEHGLDPEDCQDCIDYAQGLQDDAAEQRADAIRYGDC